MPYAADLTRIRHHFNAMMEDEIDDLPDLIARLLANSVELRLRRNLTRGYRHSEIVLTRVRGRIDILKTEARQLLSRGEVSVGSRSWPLIPRATDSCVPHSTRWCGWSEGKN